MNNEPFYLIDAQEEEITNEDITDLQNFGD